MLRKLQNELGLAILMITHDLRVAAQISHRIAVMQAGRIVEIGPAERVINSPEHPYTRELLDSAPGAASYDGLKVPSDYLPSQRPTAPPAGP